MTTYSLFVTCPRGLESVLHAELAAQGCTDLAPTDGGKIAAMLKDNDILLNVPHPRTARIQENHIVLVHALCDCIDTVLMEGM